MPAGQSSGTRTMTGRDDEKVRKDDIVGHRDKAQRRPGQSLDGKGGQIDERQGQSGRLPPAREEGQRCPESTLDRSQVVAFTAHGAHMIGLP